MSRQPLVLATDLDGTFAGGSRAARAELVHALRAHPAATLIYISGRSIPSIRDLAARAELPQPDILVADVGTSVVHGFGPEPVTEIESGIASLWPGAEIVAGRLAAIAGIERQQIDAPRRLSYWIAANRDLRRQSEGGGDFEARAADDPSLGPQAAAHAHQIGTRATAALADLSVDVLVSANVYLDVLPRGVNKGSTLLKVLQLLSVDVAGCVVAGDSLNDRALFEIGAAGIVVGNCEPALREAVAETAGVYFASGAGVDGVLEGLRRLNVLPHHEASRKDVT